MANVANLLQNANTIIGAFSTSKEFQDLLRNMSEATSKQEEERLIVAEKVRLKQKIGQPNISTKQMKEYVVRLIYCEMLGHNVSFGYIHAINLMQKTKDMLEKRTGYLAVSLFLHEDHELTILLVQTILRDLKGNNHIDMASALTVLSRLASKEIIPAVLPAVQECFNHPKELVRKKAVMCLQRFYQRAPSTVSHLNDALRRLVCDKDPSVMGASLSVLHLMVQDNVDAFRDFASNIVAILKTITDGRISRGYDYHNVPAPWYQIKLLKIIALLGQDNQATSETMYQVLLDVLKKAETGVDAAYAVLYEVITTITTIYPHPGLIQTAAKSITRFLTSTNSNLKYLGITALAAIVKVDPAHAGPHQMVVIDCLEHPDETIKRKTLDLLYKMTNVNNVVVIADKMLEFLRTTVDDYMRVELVSRITTLAEKFAPNNQWFVKTMAVVFDLGGNLVRPEVADNLMRLIAEGTDDDDLDNELRIQAVSEYMSLLKRVQLPDILMHVVAWVIGEYAYLVDHLSLEQVLDQLAVTFERSHLTPEQRGWLISSMMKVVAQLGQYPINVRAIVDKCKVSKDIDIAQRAIEFDRLVRNMTLMTSVLPVDASCEDVEVDETLSFLDDFVNDALRKPGAKRYLPPSQRKAPTALGSFVEESQQHAPKGIRFEAYEAPKPYVPTTFSSSSATMMESSHHDAPLVNQIVDGAAPISSDAGDLLSPSSLAVPDAKKKWGKSGFIGKSTPEPAAATFASTQNASSLPVSSVTAAANAAFASKSQQQQQQQQQQESSIFEKVQATAPLPKEQAAPRAPTEKEKLASALFGGIAAPAPSISAPNPGGSSAQARLAAKRAGGSSSKLTGQLVPQQSASPPPQQPLFSAPAPAAAQAVVSPSGSSGLFDLLGDDFSSSSSPSAPTNAVNSSLTQVATTPFFLGAAGFALPSELANLPGAQASPTVAAEDEFLAVRYVKVKHPTAGLVVFVHISTSSQRKSTDVQVRYDFGGATFRTALSANSGSFVQNNIFSSPAGVAANQAITNQLGLVLASHRPLPMAITATLQYSDPNHAPRSLPFQIQVQLPDFIRPLVMVTKDYGAKWVTLPQEVKVSVRPVSVSSQQQLMPLLKSGLGSHGVEIIGIEGISAAGLLGSNDEVLIHIKLDDSQGSLVTVRATNRTLAENTVAVVRSILTSN